MNKVADLKGEILDYWVARAESTENYQGGVNRLTFKESPGASCVFSIANEKILELNDIQKHVTTRDLKSDDSEWYSPSTDWAMGGPIIEREKIDIECANIAKHLQGKGLLDGGEDGNHDTWRANINGEFIQFATLPLIAAMRAIVTSKFGETVPDD